MSHTVFVRSAEGRRAFATPRGPEIGADYQPFSLTPFLARQIEDGDAEVRPEEAPSSKPKPSDASVNQ